MNDLASKTCKELREIAKGLGITGRWNMNKQELIDVISRMSDVSDDEIVFETDCIIQNDNEIVPEGSQKVTKTTADYLNNIKVGTFVAFKRNRNKDVAMSGKFVAFEDGKVVIETKQGTIFKLHPECIVWVKTGSRWPKWVFSLFNNQLQEGECDNAISEI